MHLTRTLLLAGLGIVMTASAACSKPSSPPAPPSETPAVDIEDKKAGIRADFDALVAKAKATQGPGDPVLWTLRDEDTTLHIMGTVHILRPETEWQSGEIEAALNASDTVVFEADVTSETAQQAMTPLIFSEGLFTDGRTLADLLDDGQEADLTRVLQEMGLEFDAVNPMRPWFAALTLSNVAMVKAGYDPQSGVEMVLTADAQSAGKQFDYLETAEDQILILANLPEDAQIDFLMTSVEGIEETPEMLDVLISEWADGDVQGLGVLMSDPKALGSNVVYEALLKRRNEDWVPKIEHMLDAPGTRLIAVGAAHLAGEDSVITMLREEGYEVEGP